MKIMTISENQILNAACVESFTLADKTKIPAILVGEQGRGRELGVLPVKLTSQSYQTWAEKGKVNIRYCQLGQTKSGKPKLIETESSKDEYLLLVMRSTFGFRGSNNHILPNSAEVIVKGRIAQGIAGRMGGGSQLIVRVPPDAGDIVVEIGGRLYGKPNRYTYRIKNGEVTIRDNLDIDLDELLP